MSPDIVLESGKARGRLRLSVLQKEEDPPPGVACGAESGWAAVRLSLGARARWQGTSFPGRTVPEETTSRGAGFQAVTREGHTEAQRGCKDSERISEGPGPRGARWGWGGAAPGPQHSPCLLTQPVPSCCSDTGVRNSQFYHDITAQQATPEPVGSSVIALLAPRSPGVGDSLEHRVWLGLDRLRGPSRTGNSSLATCFSHHQR